MKTIPTPPDHLATSWLYSKLFVKRAFAIYGYCLSAVLMMYGVILVIAFIIGIFIGIGNLLIGL